MLSTPSREPTPSDSPKAKLQNHLLIFTEDPPEKLVFPAKTFALAIFLTTIGLAMAIIGTIFLASTEKQKTAIPFIVIAIICGVPGFWHLQKFLKYFRAKNIDHKRQILSNIC